MFVVIEARVHERDDAKQEESNPRARHDPFHKADTIISGAFVVGVALGHTPAPFWRGDTWDF